MGAIIEVDGLGVDTGSVEACIIYGDFLGTMILNSPLPIKH